MLLALDQLVWRHVSDGHDPLAAQVQRQLDADNTERLGVDRDATPLQVYACAPDNILVGGLVGQTVWGWLNTSLLWVAQEARGRGLGAQLLARAEHLAKARGMRWARVKTTAFQARGFYEAQGYSVFATLPLQVVVRGEPQESHDFYLHKELQV